MRQSITQADVDKAMTPLHPIDTGLDIQQVGAYLAATGALVVPLYELEKAGGLKAGDPRGPAFATKQIAIGASELRDLIVMAWRGADKQTVGYRAGRRWPTSCPARPTPIRPSTRSTDEGAAVRPA